MPDTDVAVTSDEPAQREAGDYCDIEAADSDDEALYAKLNSRRTTSAFDLLAPSSPIKPSTRVPTDPLPCPFGGAEPVVLSIRRGTPRYMHPPGYLDPA